ncbi:MAG: phosphotransferase family protein, partial [Aquihabitans sp.]
VPRVRWLELDPAVIGTPFFIMDRVEGVIPSDNLPYTFGDNWLFDATPEDQRRLQDSTVEVLATLHEIDRPVERFDFLATDAPGDTPLARHVAHTRAWYDYAVSRASRSNVVEAGFEWLEANWPQETSPVLLWGDARIGNVIYRNFEPVAVLDWEMASLGPREVDLGWMIFGHMVFDEIATFMELPNMENFMETADIATTYERLTGHAPIDLHWHIVYAAVQWGIVFMRTGTRQARFGDIEMPADVDDLMHHRALLTRLLEG